MNKIGISSRTSAMLLRLMVVATLGFIVVTVITGCGNRQQKVALVPPSTYQEPAAVNSLYSEIDMPFMTLLFEVFN